MTTWHHVSRTAQHVAKPITAHFWHALALAKILK